MEETTAETETAMETEHVSMSSPVDIGRNEAVVRLIVLGGVYGRVEAEALCWLPPSGPWDGPLRAEG